MAKGKIKKWFGDKGYGFIADDAGGEDAFLHISKVQQNDQQYLQEGVAVTFKKLPSKKHSGKFDALNVRLQGAPSSKPTPPINDDSFHNPYTFIPSPPRQELGGFAGDFDPLKCGLNHATLQKDLWTGHLPIKLTTVTPLVLPKTEGEERLSTEQHQTYDTLNYLPESSLRGMLRSAYEVVTNSRYGCFQNNDRLAYRMGRKKAKYPKSPADLLHSSLKQASNRSKLSPADRLFGWVPLRKSDDQKQESKGGYKGRIRVVCEDGTRPEIVQKFDGKTLPLAILGQPKPAQGRFYVAKDDKGTPQNDGISKQNAGYSKGKGLRGRKQYWHHKGLEAGKAQNYWNPSVEDRTQQKENGRYQEYRRPSKNSREQTDSQNRSIKGWIKPGTIFKASLYVQNLQPEEVGALLWLLSLPKDHYFKLGYGKPLGFGSVRMEIDEDRCVNGSLPLGSGEDWKDYYAAFDASPPATLDKDQQNDCIEKFKVGMVAAYNPLPAEDKTDKAQEASDKPQRLTSLADLKHALTKYTPEDREQPEAQCFDALPFISGFLQVLSGPPKDVPIHYPRRDRKPNPEGKNFEWFVDNERGKKVALPAVTDAKGLPYKP